MPGSAPFLLSARTAAFSALLVLLFLSCSILPGFSREVVIQGRVLKVLDGDTIRVELDDGKKVRVRFLGIDAPESFAKRYGYTEYLGEDVSRLMKKTLSQKQVTLRVPVGRGGMKKDLHGRVLAYIHQGDTDLCAYLVKEGLARVYRPIPSTRHEELLGYEDEAKRAGKGIWNEPAEREYYRQLFLRTKNTHLLGWFWEHDRDYLKQIVCGEGQ